MKPEMPKSSWDDFLFESRHKAYGAYCLRKSYDDNIAKGFISVLLLAALAYGAFQVALLFKQEIKIPMVRPKKPDPYYPPTEILTPILKKPTPSPKPLTNKNLLLKVVKHDVAVTALPKAEDAGPVQNQNGTSNGMDDVEVVIPAGIGPSIPATEKPKIFDRAEIMPQYEGGVKAMVKFLSKKLNYPASARSIGQEGTVYVRFVVNAAGQVVEVEVIKGVSAILDREALRVVALMAKWKPGMQHGLPVNVRMVLPIKFAMDR